LQRFLSSVEPQKIMQMHQLLASLAKTRPVFHSEADFQHALAWEFHLSRPTASIRLEQPVADPGNSVHLDLLVKDRSHHVAVELKYKTRKAHITCDEEQFQLRSQSAQDQGRYDFLMDIKRIESYVEAHPGAEGYALLLTNDPTYWQESRKAHAVDTAFRIHEGRTINGKLAWGVGASEGTKLKRQLEISMRSSYDIVWRDFSDIDHQLFRYVVVHVPRVGQSDG